VKKFGLRIICIIFCISCYPLSSIAWDWNFFKKEKEVVKEIEYKLGVTIPEEVMSEIITKYSTEYGVDEVLVRKIISCESSMYGEAVNHNKDKNGVVWSTDWGLMQVNDYFHEATMSKLGLDVHNTIDSLKYGIMMLKSQGTSPWKASVKCWSK
jgi:hypothetical protein